MESSQNHRKLGLPVYLPHYEHVTLCNCSVANSVFYGKHISQYPGSKSEDYIIKFMMWNWFTGLCGQMIKSKIKERSWVSRAQAETVIKS